MTYNYINKSALKKLTEKQSAIALNKNDEPFNFDLSLSYLTVVELNGIRYTEQNRIDAHGTSWYMSSSGVEKYLEDDAHEHHLTVRPR